MFPFSAVAHLAVMGQLVLTAEPQLGRDDPDTVQDGCGVILGLGIFPIRGISLAHQQHPVYAIECICRRSDVDPKPHVVEPYLLIRHHIGGIVQETGQRHIVPGIPFGGGNAFFGQLAGPRSPRDMSNPSYS